MKSVGHLIDGEIRQTDGRQLDITNPATGEIEVKSVSRLPLKPLKR